MGGDLGEDGVGVRTDSQSRMMSSLTVISKVLVIIVDRFWVRWYTASSTRPWWFGGCNERAWSKTGGSRHGRQVEPNVRE